MTTLLFSNYANSTLAGPITNVATTIALQAGTGALFPNPSAGQAFKMSLTDAATQTLNEIMLCTARSTDSLTVTRGQEGTTALAWNAGDLVANNLTAGTMNAFLQSVATTSSFYEGTDTGVTANAVVVTATVPTNTSPAAGQVFVIQKSSMANTGTTTIQIAGGTVYPVEYKDGSQLNASDWYGGAAAILYFNGTIFQFLACQGNVPNTSLVHFGVDTGAVNAMSSTVVPPLSALVTGMIFEISPAFTNTSATVTLNVNGLGALQLVRGNGNPLQIGDVVAATGSKMLAAYDSAINSGAGGFAVINPQNVANALQTNTTYYVATTGSDSNNGLSSGTPFLTIQHALNVINNYNLNGYTVTLNIANGTYGKFIMPTVNGSGAINLVGNPATPANVLISSSNGNCIVASGSGNGYSINGIGMACSAPNLAVGDGGAGLYVGAGTNLFAQNLYFGACQCAHIQGGGGSLVLSGTITVAGGLTANVVGPGAHLYTGNSGYFAGEGLLAVPSENPVLTITTTVNIPYWIYSFGGSSNTLVYNGITGAGNVTGQKYFADLNAVIQTYGGGANYYPGTIAGTTSSGGQYA